MINLSKQILDRVIAFADTIKKNDIEAQGPKRAEFINAYSLSAILLHAKTIFFPALQAQVFAALSHEYTDRLRYSLPFPEILLQFSEPVEVNGRKLIGIALSADVWDQADHEKFAAMYSSPAAVLPDQTELHQAIGVFEDGYTKAMWQVHNREMVFDADADAVIKNLAIACIGYINCENVTLQANQTVDDGVNRKRVAKGKAPILPIYVCRLRGAQYDSAGSEQSGRHVGFRFDVRGHFRRLADGRTTWVQAHQRGLANELYVPKIYQTD